MDNEVIIAISPTWLARKMKCKFVSLCKYFDERANVCMSEEKASEFCLNYSEFDLLIEMNRKYPPREIEP